MVWYREKDMAKQYKKLIILLMILLAIPYPAYYGVNYYAAGLVDQTKLIEYRMQDAFLYCNDWRPELLNNEKDIKGYKYVEKSTTIPKDISSGNYTRTVKEMPSIKIVQWVTHYNYTLILKRL